MAALKGFIFDLEGTLIYHKARQSMLVEKALESKGIKLRFNIEDIYFLRGFNEFHAGEDFFKCLKALQESGFSAKDVVGEVVLAKQLIKKVKGLELPNDWLVALAEYKKFRKQPEFFEELQKPISGVSEALQLLKLTGMKLGVVSNASTVQTRVLFDKFSLNSFFDVLISEEDVVARKPAPDGVILALNKMSLKAKNVFVVDDSLSGITAGKVAGCKTIGVLSGNSTRAMFDALEKPDFIIDSVGNINAEYLNNLIMEVF